MLTLGVIGGMGPMATIAFLRRVIELTPATRDEHHIHILVDLDPSVPDRTAAILGVGDEPGEHLAAMARGLQAAGADILVMPCNSAHAFASSVRDAVTIPLVDWPAEAAAAAAASGAKHIGLLATTGSLVAGVYQTALQCKRLTAVLPDDEIQEGEVMAAIYAADGVKALGPASPAAHSRVERAGALLVANGAEAVMLACTELSALAGMKPLQVGAPVIDAADVVARHVVTMCAPLGVSGGMRAYFANPDTGQH